MRALNEIDPGPCAGASGPADLVLSTQTRSYSSDDLAAHFRERAAEYERRALLLRQAAAWFEREVTL